MKKFTDLSLQEYLSQLSSSQPVPGGGSVSAYTASLAMGLTQMVGKISLNRKKKPGLTPAEESKEQSEIETIGKIVESIEKTKANALDIVNLDPEIFETVMKSSGNAEAMETALENSFRLQADLALLIVMAREWNASLFECVRGSIKNDLLVSAGLYEAAFHGAFHTAMINVKYMKKIETRERSEQALTELKKRFDQGRPHGA